MDIVSLVISILAIIISLATPGINYWLNNKMVKRKALSSYLRLELGELVFRRFPEANNAIHLDKKTVTETEKIIEVLREIRKTISFYQGMMVGGNG